MTGPAQVARSAVAARGHHARPETQWLFRRLYTWALTLLSLALVTAVVCIAPREHLQLIALFLVGLIALMATLYLIAPSAAEFADIVGNLRGINFTAPPSQQMPGGWGGGDFGGYGSGFGQGPSFPSPSFPSPGFAGPAYPEPWAHAASAAAAPHQGASE